MGNLIINIFGLSFYVVSAVYFISFSDYLLALLGIMMGTFILAMNNIKKQEENVLSDDGGKK